jgi:sulfopropanediol 3-dehydrogenase
MTREYLKQALPRPASDRRALEDRVRAILDDIAANRDDAVRRYAREFDRWTQPEFRVTDDQVRAVARALPETFKEDFAYAHARVTDFARAQRDSMREFETEIEPGIVLGQKLIPVEKAGCYIPGGKYPLISAAIMSVATAKVAGVGHVIGAAPPRDAAGIYPQTLYALHASGADEIYCIGGVQALASMAFGCVGMAPRDMITGPGNAFVAEAKRQLFGTVGIDLLAGPTEIMVIADETADPALVACDLLGQAEHGPDSPAWLITTSRRFGEAVLAEVARQLETLPTAAVAGQAWEALGEVILVGTDQEAAAVSDEYAPRTPGGADRQGRLVPGPPAQLRQPLRRRAVHRGLWRQGCRHEPHAADRPRCALHRRPLGRQVHQDRHLAAPVGPGLAPHRTHHGPHLPRGGDAGARDHGGYTLRPLRTEERLTWLSDRPAEAGASREGTR